MTIRELMLAQQARHEDWTHPAGGTTCLVCGEEYPCADRVAADAVLTTLDECDLRTEYVGGDPPALVTELPWPTKSYRLVPDSEVS